MNGVRVPANVNATGLSAPRAQVRSACWDALLRDDRTLEFRHRGIVIFRVSAEDVPHFLNVISQLQIAAGGWT